MVLQPEHSEVIEWIATKHEEQKVRLREAEALLKAMPTLNEANALVMRLNESVAYYAALLNLVENAFRKTSSKPGNEDAPEYTQNRGFSSTSSSFDEDDEFIEDDDEEKINNSESQEKLAPRDFIRFQFKDMSQADAVLAILESCDKPMSIEEVATVLYQTDSEEIFRRAKDSISVALRSGAEAGKWQKVDRGVFASNNVAFAKSIKRIAEIGKS
ncbi:hypothetical protein NDI49_20435 [Trichocoleus sp. ST-U3]